MKLLMFLFVAIGLILAIHAAIVYKSPAEKAQIIANCRQYYQTTHDDAAEIACENKAN